MASKRPKHCIPPPKPQRAPVARLPADEDRQFTQEEVEFMMAMDRLKRRLGGRYPTYPEILAEAKLLGYYLPE